MNDSEKAVKLLLERASSYAEVQEKEDLLRNVLRSGAFGIDDLKELAQRSEISRHLSLIHLLERSLESIEFAQSDTWASNRSKAAIVAELLLMAPVGEPRE